MIKFISIPKTARQNYKVCFTDLVTCSRCDRILRGSHACVRPTSPRTRQVTILMFIQSVGSHMHYAYTRNL